MATMRLRDIYKQTAPVISFEIFPPKTAEGIEPLLAELQKLKQFNPGLISVTYGAGGTTQGRSLKLLEKIVKELRLNLMTHLTCIGSSPESIQAFLRKVSAWGVENILALRGDWPKDQPDYRPESNVFQHAVDLVNFTRQNIDADIAVAGFPEKHPEAPDQATDIRYLRAKAAAGACAVFTQLFFDNQYYYDYVSALCRAGLEIPVIPGIWTITNLKQIQKTAELSRAKIPDALLAQLQQASEKEVREIGIAYAARQVRDLLANGAPGVHLYTLNKADTVTEVLRQSGR